MKVRLDELNELEYRATYHSYNYKDYPLYSKVTIARISNKLYIVDGYATVRRLKEQGAKEVEAEILEFNSLREVYEEHIKRNQRGSINSIALAVICKEYELDYLPQKVLDRLEHRYLCSNNL